MTKDGFITNLRDALEWPDGEFSATTVLAGNDRWDSVALLAAMSLVDEKLGLTLSASDLEDVSTVGDLVALVSERLD